MLGLKLIDVSKRGPREEMLVEWETKYNHFIQKLICNLKKAEFHRRDDMIALGIIKILQTHGGN